MRPAVMFNLHALSTAEYLKAKWAERVLGLLLLSFALEA